MKTVGIIGGLGPETTANFYLEIVFSAFDKTKISRPPMLIWNVPLPYAVEEAFITKGEDEEKYIPYLIDAAQRLKNGGADFIVIPCNSVHIFIDEVRHAVDIPVLSIVEETLQFLQDHQITDVGILATSATIRKMLYETKLREKNISVAIPSDVDQDRMGQIINHLVHSTHTDDDKSELLAIIDRFNPDIQTLLLACTDLQLLVSNHHERKVYDTMKILADATVREILS